MPTLSASDREAIRELTFRYAWHLDHGEWDSWKALFTADGSWGAEGGRPFEGQEALSKFAAGLQKKRLEGAPAQRHFIAEGWIQPLENGGARLLTYLAVIVAATGAIKTCGEYHITFAREGDGWLIRELKFVPVATAPAPAPAS